MSLYSLVIGSCYLDPQSVAILIVLDQLSSPVGELLSILDLSMHGHPNVVR